MNALRVRDGSDIERELPIGITSGSVWVGRAPMHEGWGEQGYVSA
jgi:hypothetical protein